MKAIVLAAGYGTRLYPLTKDTPKPLISVAGRPIIEHIIHAISEVNGINEVIVVTNNRFFSRFEEWLKDCHYSMKITLINDLTNNNEDRLGAIGDIDFAVKSANIDEDLLVVAGDNLFDFSLLSLHEFFIHKKASVVALYDLEDKEKVAGKLGVAELGSDFRIIGFEEKPSSPKSSLASTACYFFTKADLKLLEKCINEHQKPDNLGDFIKWLSSRTHVYGFVFTERWFDIGSHGQLGEADAHWRSKYY